MKPQDLLIGVRDILALLIPGTILLLLLPVGALGWLARKASVGGSEPNGTLFLFLFLVAALATGSLLSAIAGRVDDLVDNQLEQEFRGWPHFPGRSTLCRHLQKLKAVRDLAGALETKVTGLGTQASPRAWTARSFWWNYLRLHCAAAIAELDRIEGLQKQFRSLALVGLVLGLVFPATLFLRIVPLGTLPFETPSSLLVAAPAFAKAVAALVAACLCFLSYAVYRISFSRRLFELALIHAIPSDRVATEVVAILRGARAPEEAATPPGREAPASP